MAADTKAAELRELSEEELITRLRETHPALKVLILTGHGAMLDDEGFGWWTHERHLAKPCRVRLLRTTTVATAL